MSKVQLSSRHNKDLIIWGSLGAVLGAVIGFVLSPVGQVFWFVLGTNLYI